MFCSAIFPFVHSSPLQMCCVLLTDNTFLKTVAGGLFGAVSFHGLLRALGCLNKHITAPRLAFILLKLESFLAEHVPGGIETESNGVDDEGKITLERYKKMLSLVCKYPGRHFVDDAGATQDGTRSVFIIDVPVEVRASR